MAANINIDPIAEALSNYSELARRTKYDRTHISRALQGLRGYSDNFVRCIANVTGIGFLEVVDHIERNRRRNKDKRLEMQRKGLGLKIDRLGQVLADTIEKIKG